MLHVLFDRRPWFRAKSHGYGAGLPIAWQGWLMLGMHLALMVGAAVLLLDQPILMTIATFFCAFAPLPLYRARTEGGWRWRWGRREGR